MICRWWQLAIRNWRARFFRSLAESIAVVIACALVVLLTSGFASAERTLWAWHARWVGRVDLQVAGDGGRWLDESLVAKLASDPAVHRASGRITDQAQVLFGGRTANVQIRGRQVPEDFEIKPTTLLAGRMLNDPAAFELILDSSIAQRLGAGVGDAVQIRIYSEMWDFEVVGVADRPPALSFAPQAVHAPLGVAQRILDRPGVVDCVYLDFADGVSEAEQMRLVEAAVDGPFEVLSGADKAAMLAEHLRLFRSSMYILCSALLALAVFLIFATLAGALVGRVKELGTLRCLGASRRQTAALVLIEAAPLAVWGVLLGVPAGLGGAWLLVRWRSDLFSQGWSVSVAGVILAVVGVTAATAAGALLPAIGAARMNPIRAGRPRGLGVRRAVTACMVVAGLVLAAAPLALVYAADDGWSAMRTHALAGLPMLAVGAFLATPLLMWLLVPPLGRLVGLLLRVHPTLVVRQVLRTRWRSAALVMAVALCVALVVRVRTETESMLAGARLPTEFPDLVVIAPTGVSREEVVSAMAELGVENWTGLNGFDVHMRGARAQQGPNIIQALMNWRTGNTWFLSLDADRFDKVADLTFVQGSSAEAAARLREPDTVIVTESFAEARDAWLGARLPMLDYRGEPFELEVAGVVNSLSLESAGGAFDLGDLYRRNAAFTVLGSSETALGRFKHGGYSVMLIDVNSPAEGDRVGAGLQRLWRDRPVEHLMLRRLKERITSEFRLIATIVGFVGGLLAAAVAAVGVANAMGADIHNRRRELGVLHAVGMTRGQLVRLVLAEALVLGLVGAVAGVAGGAYGSSMGLRIAELMWRRPWEFTLPVGAALAAAGMAVAAAALASLAAALRAGRAGVLDLMDE